MRSRVQEQIYDGIQEIDAEFAYPHSHLFFDETSGELDVRGLGGGAGQRPQVRSDRPRRPGPARSTGDSPPSDTEEE